MRLAAWLIEVDGRNVISYKKPAPGTWFITLYEQDEEHTEHEVVQPALYIPVTSERLQ